MQVLPLGLCKWGKEWIGCACRLLQKVMASSSGRDAGSSWTYWSIWAYIVAQVLKLLFRLRSSADPNFCSFSGSCDQHMEPSSHPYLSKRPCFKQQTETNQWSVYRKETKTCQSAKPQMSAWKRLLVSTQDSFSTSCVFLRTFWLLIRVVGQSRWWQARLHNCQLVVGY